MKNIEIPLTHERNVAYRLFEILPGFLSWSLLLLPVLLSRVDVNLAAFFVIAYLMLWFVKSIGLNIRALEAYHKMNIFMKMDWLELLDDIRTPQRVLDAQPVERPNWHINNLRRFAAAEKSEQVDRVIHAIIIALYNETEDVLEPTIQTVLRSNFDLNRVVLFLAYEGRGGPATEALVNTLVERHGSKFKHMEAVKHPDGIPNEIRGKGGNITFAGRRLAEWVRSESINPKDVVVTTLDSDNRPHPNYLAALTYNYVLCAEPHYSSFQPVAVFTNNIWDAPAPMRVIATGNSFWMMVQALRPHMLRNFAAHSQSLSALIDTDFWSVRTIVEDGHQFWRTYFRFDGKHEVLPILLPVYQDAVLASTYRKTLKAQFVQIRRWAWGASDIAYVAKKGFLTRNSINKFSLFAKFMRLVEGHISWATAPLILAFSGLIPGFVSPNASYSIVAIKLPLIASNIQRIALVGVFLTLFLSFKMLPPRPERYKRHRTLLMVIQWVYMPITTICYSSFAAIYSQTRLMFGRYLDKFDVTEKAVKK